MVCAATTAIPATKLAPEIAKDISIIISAGCWLELVLVLVLE